MNSRDGMRRLRAERRMYGLCMRCGARLESGYMLRTCPKCLELQRMKQKAARERKQNNGEN